MVERTPDWYRNAVFYAVDVEVFCDGDGDGIGDFRGLTERLDYLAALGVDCLWVLPFYPSPNRDNGYDVTDHLGVDPRLGTLEDVATFLREVEARGIRAIADLVVNHTSDRHPWFQAARSDPNSPYRDFYGWRTEPPHETDGEQVVWKSDELDRSAWSYDPVAGAYYWHRFYDFEPDLNFSHPPFRDEVRRIVRFWLELGFAGFRIDAAPFLGEAPAGSNASPTPRQEILRDLRSTARAVRADALLLAEADASPVESLGFFDDGRGVQMLFGFYVNNFLFLALARESAEPLRRACADLPPLPPGGVWLNWVRNYDELDLERLADEERVAVFARFAPEERMRIYGRGIRRRFPPMVEGDRRRIELAYALMLTLPGAPMLMYGEEIGMGDDLSLGGRTSVRTPMQWAPEPGGGFSPADPSRFPRPLIADGPYGHERVNVAAQLDDPNSLLCWMRRAIAPRRSAPAIGLGTTRSLESGNEAVLAHAFVHGDDAFLAVHNLSGQPRRVTLGLAGLPVDRLAAVFGDGVSEGGLGGEIVLSPYGYRWFRT